MNPNSMFTSRDRKQPTNPHARKLDVEADLKPLLAFLQGEAGMSQEQVVKVRAFRAGAVGLDPYKLLIWAGGLPGVLASCGCSG